MMKKILLIIYLLLVNFCFAQTSKKDTLVEGKTYHFDISMDIKSKNYQFNKTATFTKFINSKDDSYFGYIFSPNNIAVFDLKDNSTLIFKKKENEKDVNFEYESGTKLSNNNFKDYKIKVKKLSEKQFEIRKIRKKDDYIWLKIILNIEQSDFEAANSLDLNDVMNMDYSAIQMLRKKVKLNSFIISDYRATYFQTAVNTSSILKAEKVDYTLFTPKEFRLKFPQIIKGKELVDLKNKQQ